jgi:hypothetical protein
MKLAVRLALSLVMLLTGARALGDVASREASAHFQRGVELYNDGDYRGALVEFKRAYAIWPRANVLYDVGQTEFQLLDYAAALKTMERYLAETGANAVHRAEVESTVEVLRGRVGRVALVVDAPDCEVTVDDQPAGSTPLAQPLLVSVGQRKLAVACPGRPPAVRRVEVAAGELARVELKLKLPAAVVAHSTGTPATTPARVEPPARPSRLGMAVSWSLCGLLAVAAVGAGSAALVEENRLQSLKASYPVTRDVLDHQSSLTLGLSIAADALGAAALAAGGVATWLTVKYDKERKLQLGLSGTRVQLAATF